jgi:small subunit ribosomal protein S2
MSITMKQLLDAGAHFGHQTHRWNPKMKPYIYGARNGIYIINLEKTLEQWQKARKAIVDAVTRGGKVLFVGTKPQAAEIVQEEAERSKQLFVNRRWLGGMLTNFETIKKRIQRMEELERILTTDESKNYYKKDLMSMAKEKLKLERSLSGIKAMSQTPALVVVVDPNKEHIAVLEAKKLGIPIISITDTNCDPDNIDHVLPANDDALKSVRLFFSEIANACIEGGQAFEIRIQEETRRRMQQEMENKKKAKDAKPEETTQIISDNGEKGPVVEKKKTTKKTDEASANNS